MEEKEESKNQFDIDDTVRAITGLDEVGRKEAILRINLNVPLSKETKVSVIYDIIEGSGEEGGNSCKEIYVQTLAWLDNAYRLHNYVLYMATSWITCICRPLTMHGLLGFWLN